MRRRALVLGVVLSSAAAACFTDEGAATTISGGLESTSSSTTSTSTADSTADATTDATTDASTSAQTTTTTTADATTDEGSTSEADSEASTSEATATSTGDDTTTTSGGLGCAGPEDCGDEEFCDFPDVLCGLGDAGVCAPRPLMCGSRKVVTFGCDCVEYPSPCAAQMAGADVRGNIVDCL